MNDLDSDTANWQVLGKNERNGCLNGHRLGDRYLGSASV